MTNVGKLLIDIWRAPSESIAAARTFKENANQTPPGWNQQVGKAKLDKIRGVLNRGIDAVCRPEMV